MEDIFKIKENMEKHLRVIFFGSEAVSLEFLKMIHQTEDLIGVISQPDKPRGRGGKLFPTMVKKYAIENKIPFWDELSDRSLTEIGNLNPDLSVVVDYGRIIPERFFNLPKFGSINVHFSLLPKYRGAAPLEWAIMNGETETGVTIFQLSDEMDAGEIILKKSIEISYTDDYWSLERKAVKLGISMLSEVLKLYKEGRVKKEKQIGEPSFARKLNKSDGLINWEETAIKIYNKVRALKKWPVSFTYIGGRMVKIIDVEVYDGEVSGQPGEICKLLKGKGFIVKSKDGAILVKRVKPESRKEMDAWSFWIGARISLGQVCNF